MDAQLGLARFRQRVSSQKTISRASIRTAATKIEPTAQTATMMRKRSDAHLAIEITVSGVVTNFDPSIPLSSFDVRDADFGRKYALRAAWGCTMMCTAQMEKKQGGSSISIEIKHQGI